MEDEILFCASCGSPLTGDPDEDPTGDNGMPICGNCARPWHNAMLARIEAFGFLECIQASVPADRGPLADCPCGPAPDCRHVQTLRQSNDPNGVPVQVDLMYAKGRLRNDLVGCTALNSADDPSWALSDHCPVIAEFKDVN